MIIVITRNATCQCHHPEPRVVSNSATFARNQVVLRRLDQPDASSAISLFPLDSKSKIGTLSSGKGIMLCSSILLSELSDELRELFLLFLVLFQNSHVH